ncbi:hypothetical protein F5Y14DRAFT_419835 [Nemania sp. NC0429]|nr:hypothetical protein F5Y14DRAFT_419835 [Nemania sp. NC0429]
MAAPRDPVAGNLRLYFHTHHGFEHERQIAATIIYKRNTPDGTVERIVVKYGKTAMDGDTIDTEEDILRSLWGAEHIIKLLSVVSNRQHSGRKWQEPFARELDNPNPILPWKLPISELNFPVAARSKFFIMEYLPRGTASELVERCEAMNIDEISEPLLWYFFLCLTRACVAMAYPPSARGREPPRVLREMIPRHRPRPILLGHWDLHLGNIMFGEYDDDPEAQPVCHQVTPILKVIDFGMSQYESTEEDSIFFNVRQTGEAIYELAIMDASLPDDDEDRGTFLIDDDLGWTPFLTFASEEFCRDPKYSQKFRHTVARCLAVDWHDRPNLQYLLNTCMEQADAIGNPYKLADEVNELFDFVPTNDDDGSEYEPSDESVGSDSF